MAEGVLQIHGATQHDPLFLARRAVGDVFGKALDGEAIAFEGRLQERQLPNGFGALLPLLTPRLLSLQREERKGIKA